MAHPTSQIEIPFEWTCPKCGHTQTDTVNPVLGPFVTVICGECQGTFPEDALTPQDRAAFDAAVELAETYLPAQN
jgi:transcription elongation factor Elf1